MSLREDVKAFVDGELSPERAAEFEAALQSDPSLAAEVEAMKSLTERVRNLGRLPQPTGLDETLGRVAPERRFPAARLLWAGGAFVALVLVGLIGPRLTGFRPLAPQAEMAMAPAATPGSEPADSAMAESGAEYKSKDAPLERSRVLSDTAAPDAGRNAATGSEPKMPGTVIDPNRQVVRRADLGLAVKDARLALADATRYAGAVGGYVESSGLQNLGDRPTASLVMRVPQTKFDATLSMLRGLGEVETETLSGEDVTAQVADLDARVRALAGQEQQYLVLLRSARRIGEIMEIRDRLGEVRQEIESLKAQSKALKGLAAMSTVSATFVQKPSVDDPVKPSDWSERAWAEAVAMLTVVGRALATGLIYVLVLVPVWLPILLVGWWLRRRPK
jgi:anti-sigma factor RsiW